MPAKRISKEHEEQIIALYLDGYSLSQAAAQFGYSNTAAVNALKRNSIPARTNFEASSISKEAEDLIVAAYLEGKTLTEAAAVAGHSIKACINALKRRGIPSRSSAEQRRRYTLDQTFFDVIDTEQKAYWLGFITADGCVYQNTLWLGLQATDVDHLHKFATAIQSQQPVGFRYIKRKSEKHHQAYLNLNSERVVKALKELGVAERKSFDGKPCEKVPPHLLPAYWRGLFDGDGSIGHYTSPNLHWRATLVGNYYIVNAFRDYVATIITSRATVGPRGKIFGIQYAGLALPRTIIKVLYGDATVYLDRKYALAQELIATAPF
jgi:predicted HTH domain antitoxin